MHGTMNVKKKQYTLIHCGQNVLQLLYVKAVGVSNNQYA